MLLNEQIKANLGDKKLVGVRQGNKFILGRHNLVQNGRGKYTSGMVEVRRNLAKYPGCTDSRSVYGWAGAAPASTEMSIETVDWTVSGKAVQTVWVTGGSGECGPRIDSTGTDGLTE